MELIRIDDSTYDSIARYLPAQELKRNLVDLPDDSRYFVVDKDGVSLLGFALVKNGIMTWGVQDNFNGEMIPQLNKVTREKSEKIKEIERKLEGFPLSFSLSFKAYGVIFEGKRLGESGLYLSYSPTNDNLKVFSGDEDFKSFLVEANFSEEKLKDIFMEVCLNCKGILFYSPGKGFHVPEGAWEW